MSKVLTVSIAAYNVGEFIEKTLDSLVIPSLDRLEVLVINDGSKDDTSEKAKRYEQKYPGVFRVIDKQNGGYGSTINTGIEHATGKYFKQLDGDDTYITENLEKVCALLEDTDTDVVYTPFVTVDVRTGERVLQKNSVDGYEGSALVEEVLPKVDPTFVMHSLAFKTQILKDNGIRIDEHCFYTDTEYVLFPLLYSKTITVMNDPVYLYRIGDVNQSVGRLGKLRHYKEHIRMSYSLLEHIDRVNGLSENIKRYCKSYMAAVFASGIGNYLMLLKPTRENYALIREYYGKIKATDEEIANMMGELSSAVRIFARSSYAGYVFLNLSKAVKRRLGR